MQSEPAWLDVDLILAIHDEQLAEHGGTSGVRDLGLLESALARPRERYAYDPAASDIPALSAWYASSLARNHPFIDGNKRVALVAMETFLRLNGHRLAVSNVELVATFLDLASGNLADDAMIAWVRAHAKQQSPAAMGDPTGLNTIRPFME